jgi:hypothetical protein
MMPGTYRAVSLEMTGEVLPPTPVNQDYIAMMKVQQLLDRGHSVRDIGLIWNGSLAGKEKPVAKRGINRWGVPYDTVAYANKILGTYETINQEQEYQTP